jgi:arylsulfatase A-like enzyme
MTGTPIRLSMLATPLVAAFLAVPAAAAPRLPNVVLIMTDNHSPWTLGCYGNREIRTPNIDRLAEQGMLFTNCYSSNAVCSPTRATFLTGLIPSQHGVHCYLAGGRAQIGPLAYNMIEEFDTLPKILARSGYTCGLTGKWHLGDNLHPQEGFTYWITKPHGHTSTFYDAEVIENGEIRKEPKYLTDLWTEHAVHFIEMNKDRPFFLFLAYNGPYGLGGFLDRPARNRHAEYYADKELTCFPRVEPHEWLGGNRRFIGNIDAMRRYAAEVSGVDDGIGEVTRRLRELGLEDDTLLIFTADQGLSGGHNGMWGMGDHSRPLHTFDKTMHIPLIYRWPEHIKPGTRSDLMVSNYDLLRTVLSLLGRKSQMPTVPESPGRDLSPVLKGETVQWDNTIFYEFENCRTIRTLDWKLTLRVPDGPNELYHLKTDPGESKNLIDDPSSAAEEAKLRERLTAFFDRYADPRYDLWREGQSKTILQVYGKDRMRPLGNQ